ncbi:hypothetical protein RYX36_018608, partial [Vicia faba]
IESGPGGDNSKSQLQTLLTRAGYAAPIYKTKQLKNNQFRSSVELNGVEIMGQPCNNKKSAEKDAAAEALQWIAHPIRRWCPCLRPFATTVHHHVDHNSVPPSGHAKYRTESGPGGDNSKSQLQTLLTREGYAAPIYKTKQLKNNQFRSSVELNGVEIMGQPCNNKKSAEKDAAAEALQ